MVYYLRTTSGGGSDLGILSIYVNEGAESGTEAWAWEWQGDGINTGGSFAWQNDGDQYYMTLFLSNGDRFGTVNGAWDSTPRPEHEPRRPWFSRQGVSAGIGSRVEPGPPPQRLLPGFNWRLR
jgi:hypothetical protein